MPVVTLADTLRELFDMYGLYMLMLILLVIMVVTALPRKKTEVGLELATAQAAAGVADQGEMVESILDISIEEQSELKKQIDRFVQQNPDAVAQLLRNWIAEDWD